MGLGSYVSARIIEAVPLILSVIVLDFFLLHAVPGDPAVIIAGEAAFPEQIEVIRERWGLNRPLIEQFWIYMTQVLQGNLGYSFSRNQPVLSIILEKIPATLLLMLPTQILAMIVGTILGVYSAGRPFTRIDISISIFSLGAYSMPVFWFGLMLILVFALGLGMFPASGMVTVTQTFVGMAHMADILWHMILPIVTLGAFYTPTFLNISRAAVMEVMKEDYITTARAKGLDEKTILFRHGLRNALLPTVTIAGLSLGFAVTGAILTETVFGWPGMGRLLYDAILLRDYPLLMGMLTLTSIMVVLANLLTDICYAALDPRVVYK